MKLLFLDDAKDPLICATYMYARQVNCTIYHEKWAVVRSYGEFVKWIKENGLPDVISFDHDLGDVPELLESLPRDYWFCEEKNRLYTGMDCARWLADYCIDNNKKLPEFVVHSQNPDGYLDIKKYLENYKKHSDEK